LDGLVPNVGVVDTVDAPEGVAEGVKVAVAVGDAPATLGLAERDGVGAPPELEEAVRDGDGDCGGVLVTELVRDGVDVGDTVFDGVVAAVSDDDGELDGLVPKVGVLDTVDGPEGVPLVVAERDGVPDTVTDGVADAPPPLGVSDAEGVRVGEGDARTMPER
jgi:hypothetical protein